MAASQPSHSSDALQVMPSNRQPKTIRPLTKVIRDIWRGMIRRCLDERHHKYHRYGGRGITVCQEWQSFEAFRLWSEMAGYSPGLSIDRIDNDGPYSPDNCHFITPAANNRNRSTSRVVSAFGESKVFAEWARDSRCVVSRNCLLNRLNCGVDPELAMTTPAYDKGMDAMMTQLRRVTHHMPIARPAPPEATP